MQAQIEQYLEAIRNNYRNRGSGNTSPEVVAAMTKEFCDAMCITEGKQYIKVITGPQRSVHSFIVKEDGAKFKKGDILKAASWAAPAKNFARGNVFDQASFVRVEWTGA